MTFFNLLTYYTQDFHIWMWITERLFYFLISDRIETRKKRKVVSEMAMLSDEMLLDSYHMAIELQLERDFIELLLGEILRRELNTDVPAVFH